MFTASKASYQRAIDAATEAGLVRTVRYHGAGSYSVAGSTGNRYHVGLLHSGELRCRCKAGEMGYACRHAAAVWLKLKGEQACRARTDALLAAHGAPASRHDATAAPHPSGGGMRGARLDDEAAFAETWAGVGR